MARSLAVLAFAVSTFMSTVIADPAQDLEARGGSVCDSGIYGELAPILSAYPVAQAFCTSAYPPKCNTAIAKRALPSTTTKLTLISTSASKPSSKSSSTTAKSTTSSKPSDVRAVAWSKIAAQASNVVSTLCSCIQGSPKACSTTASTTTMPKSSVTTIKTVSSSSSSSTTTKNTTPSTTSTSTRSTTPSSSFSTTSTTSTTVNLSSTTSSSTTSASSPVHTIDAPRCNAATANGIENGGCSDQCTCEPDVEGVYYCGSATDNVGCDANDQCPQGQYCASNSVSCNTGNVPGDECTSSFNAGTKRSLNGLRTGRLV